MEVIEVPEFEDIKPHIEVCSDSLTPIVSKDGIRIPRPPNAFMIFGKEYRKIVSLKFPEFSNKQISKILGDEWKKMSGERKNHYHKLADETYKQHLIKYPGYYYSPLEARERKAERKRKSKMSRNASKPNETIQSVNSNAGHFRLNSPFLMRGSYPMVRPMFGTPMPVRHGTHYRPQMFGGFGGFRQQSRPTLVPPLHNEHNYATFPQQQQSIQQIAYVYQTNPSSQFNQLGQKDNQKAVYQMESTDLSALLTNYLPPMHNPSTEVTQVVDNEEMKDETKVTKMVSASLEDEILPTLEQDDLLSKVIEESLYVNKEAKVIVKCMDQCFDEPMETSVSTDDSSP